MECRLWSSSLNSSIEQPAKVGDPMLSEEGAKLFLHKGKNDHGDHQHHHDQESPIGTREEERHGRRGECQDEQSSQPTSGDRIYQPDQNNLRVKEEQNKICSGAWKLFKEARKVNPDKYRPHDGSTGRKLSTRAPADFEVTRWIEK